jgi:hypothetical protein
MREGGVLEARVGQIYHTVLREGGRSGYGWIIMFALTVKERRFPLHVIMLNYYVQSDNYRYAI